MSYRGKRKVSWTDDPAYKAVEAYEAKGRKSWGTLQRGWLDSAQAKADAELFLDGYSRLPRSMSWTLARDRMEIEYTKKFLGMTWQRRNWSNARLARLAAQLEDVNCHTPANYIRSVVISGAPEEVYVNKLKAMHKRLD